MISYTICDLICVVHYCDYFSDPLLRSLKDKWTIRSLPITIFGEGEPTVQEIAKKLRDLQLYADLNLHEYLPSDR